MPSLFDFGGDTLQSLRQWLQNQFAAQPGPALLSNPALQGLTPRDLSSNQGLLSPLGKEDRALLERPSSASQALALLLSGQRNLLQDDLQQPLFQQSRGGQGTSALQPSFLQRAGVQAGSDILQALLTKLLF